VENPEASVVNIVLAGERMRDSAVEFRAERKERLCTFTFAKCISHWHRNFLMVRQKVSRRNVLGPYASLANSRWDQSPGVHPHP
jgi:hypothetical protein